MAKLDEDLNEMFYTYSEEQDLLRMQDREIKEDVSRAFEILVNWLKYDPQLDEIIYRLEDLVKDEDDL